MNLIILKKGRDRSILKKHPWIFSGAIKKESGTLKSGETAIVYSADGGFLCRGSYSPNSQIRVRAWSFDENETIDEDFFKKVISNAVLLRKELGILNTTDSYRLISAESDGIPGLIVDRYKNFLVCQFLSAGCEYFKDTIIDILKDLPGVEGIYERSDSLVRKKEGLTPTKGNLFGKEPPNIMEINEHELKLLVDIKNGHKTGYYLDQRVNRKMVTSYCNGKKVLNCFAYTGGFGLAALKGCAKSVINIEYSGEPIEIIEKNIELNGFKNRMCENIKGDVFKVLREFEKEEKLFDVIILDPPKFAESKRNIEGAARGYKDINRIAMNLLNPNGYLFTYSCSGLIDLDFFKKIVSDAAIDAKKNVHILKFLYQSPDHPINLSIPESLYLKGLLLRVS